MNKKIIPIILIIVGAAFLLGALAFFLDSLTSAQPRGLGEQILNVLSLLLGAGTSLAGLIGLSGNKKEKPASVEVQQEIKDMRGGTVIGKVENLNLPQPVPKTHDTIGFIPSEKTVTYVHRGSIENDVRTFLKNGGTLKNTGQAGAIVGLHAAGAQPAKTKNNTTKIDFRILCLYFASLLFLGRPFATCVYLTNFLQ